MKNTNLKIYLLALLSLLLALPVLFLTVEQITSPKERQEIRKEAATPTGTATLFFVPASETVFATQEMPIDIQFQTPSTPGNKGITGIKAVFSYNNASALELTETDITSRLASPWQYSRKEVTTSGSTTTVVIEAAYLLGATSGYTGAVGSPQTFVTLNFLAKDPGSGPTTIPINFTFDTTRSIIMSKQDNEDILSSSLAGGSYTVYIDNAAPETTITSGPTEPLRVAEASFTFTGNDNPPVGSPTEDLVYSYRLDSGTWSAYSSSSTATLTGFTRGSHTFYVRAKDIIGNVDATPASWEFSYEPKTTLELKLLMDDLLSPPGCLHYDKAAQVTIRNASYNPGAIQAAAVYESTPNLYSITVNLPDDMPSGSNSFEVLVKVRSYLQRNLGTTTLTKDADNFLDRSSSTYKLLAGDVTEDNYLMLDDITGVISVWTSTVTPTTDQTLKYDLTEDGSIAINDITAIISYWTASETPGDF